MPKINFDEIHNKAEKTIKLRNSTDVDCCIQMLDIILEDVYTFFKTQLKKEFNQEFIEKLLQRELELNHDDTKNTEVLQFFFNETGYLYFDIVRHMSNTIELNYDKLHTNMELCIQTKKTLHRCYRAEDFNFSNDYTIITDKEPFEFSQELINNGSFKGKIEYTRYDDKQMPHIYLYPINNTRLETDIYENIIKPVLEDVGLRIRYTNLELSDKEPLKPSHLLVGVENPFFKK